MKNIETVKIADFIAALQEHVKDFKFKGLHGEFHEKVISIVAPLLNDYDNVSIGLWEITVRGRRHPLLNYAVNFVKDKRSDDYRPKGTFTDVQFKTPNADTDINKTFGEYFAEEDLQALRDRIISNSAIILELQNKLKQAQAQQESMQQELLFKLS